ncbi:MAG: hypothetical protein HOV81_24675 [Kofleriaceae bacterium]|nr:hypothetical protein [Kofleriaceae bacterium]
MRSSISFVSLFFVFVLGCVGEHAKGDDAGSGSQESPVEPDWLATPYVSRIAVDASHVYFVAGGGAELSRSPIAGGAAEALYTVPSDGTSFDMIDALVVGANDIVFVVDGYDTDTQAQTRTLYALAKAGGSPRMLASSQDSRAYLGVTIDGDYVYFTSFTSLVRVPLAGGTSQFVGESPESVQYWAFSPTVVGDKIVWAESQSLFAIAKGSSSREGMRLAYVPGSGKIIGSDAVLVVALSSQIDFLGLASKFIEVDPTTGLLGPVVDVGTTFDDAAVTADAVWAATSTGLVRVPRAGGAPEQVTTVRSLSIAAGSEAVFVGTEDGITRVKLQ